jgi:hypothetical protein
MQDIITVAKSILEHQEYNTYRIISESKIDF